MDYHRFVEVAKDHGFLVNIDCDFRYFLEGLLGLWARICAFVLELVLQFAPEIHGVSANLDFDRYETCLTVEMQLALYDDVKAAIAARFRTVDVVLGSNNIES